MNLDDLFSDHELRQGRLCKAMSRHLMAGIIWERTNPIHNTMEWVEDFRCEFCLTERRTLCEVNTGKPFGGRAYIYTVEYDKSLTNDVARADMMQRLFKATRNG